MFRRVTSFNSRKLSRRPFGSSLAPCHRFGDTEIYNPFFVVGVRSKGTFVIILFESRLGSAEILKPSHRKNEFSHKSAW